MNIAYNHQYILSGTIMHKLLTSLSAAALFAFTTCAQAGPLIYAQVGKQNVQEYTFTAAATGDIVAYFVGSTATYTNEITLLVNGVATGIQGLNNKTTKNNTALTLGTVQTGDSLVFKLVNIVPGTGVGPWYSQKSLNSDGINHIYSSAWAGDRALPAGTFVAFEDLPKGGDFNYNDISFVFTNVATNAPAKGTVPEPGSLALLGLGIVGFAASRRKGVKAA
jgi:hypothetical protein